MATGVVLLPDSQLKEWHDPQNSCRHRPTIRNTSNLSLSSMARSPAGAESGGNLLSQKPRLPSFGNFLSGAGRPDLKFAQHNSASSRGDPGLSNTTSLNYHAAQPSVYEQSPLHPSDPTSRARGLHPDHNQGTVWPYPNSRALERHTALPTVPTQGPPLDRAQGRIVVREEVIPGKGVCYIYDDGTYCQKIINGDAVNPKWGTTKAGKPRKRLGQACNTCREKKIKCDPSYPKCTQCLKFGRECKFESV